MSRPPSRRRGKKTPRGPKKFSAAQLAARAAALPVVTYPDLPVSDHRDEIAEAIRHNQVVIVAGETGSGKTTQLPKICLQEGRGIAGMIGHTQPRRLAARAVADRIAAELDQTVGRAPGDVVGYQVRFTDQVGPTTLIKLMTDGILLAEMGSDPLLSKYDTIIVDEAHERSLNIDFILGYLGRLLPQRPDLKVIITSATIDSERFQKHFEKQINAPVPVIEVSGRTYPVEVRYRPLVADTTVGESEGALTESSGEHADAASPLGTALIPEPNSGELATLGYGLGETLDVEEALVEAVDELLTEPDGDILVFLPGERDILEARDALAEHLGPRYVEDRRKPHRQDGVEILPLFARLSSAEQHRIYQPGHLQRVILSTNIAETSLTVPGIRYVIDAGLARISRFSNKTKVQRLPIEGVSKASAGQRAGRAGRTSPGIAVRLYSERDYAQRPDFTEPEILRTSLASVILQMKALGLGDVKDFPFLDPPAARAVRDGIQLLVEIGALTPDERITRLGRKLARLPIDPRLGRMLVEADRLGCASEVLVIVAALSIQDPRERPVERQAEADLAHARYVDKRSDFITYLNMWRYLNTQSRDMSGSAFRRMCRREYFHYMRFREWRDIVRQLTQMCREVGIKTHRITLPSHRDIARYQGDRSGRARGKDPVITAAVEHGLSTQAADPNQIHMAILTGLLSNIGNWDDPKRQYAGPRGTAFVIWPGSGLKGRRPEWVMAAELVETSRLFARTVAGIEAQWVERYAKHLVKRSYSEPTWSRARGAAQVTERVTLYGLTLAADRKVPLTRLGNQDLGADYAASVGAANPALALAMSSGMQDEARLTANVLAREMFITNALVEGDWRENHHKFVRHNRQVMETAADMAERMRDPSLVPDEAVRYQFFATRIPQHVTSAAAFNKWWKDARTKHPHLLDYDLEDLVPQTEEVDETNFPSTWRQGDLTLPLAYSFDPGDDRDGVTVSVPLDVLSRVEDDGFDWLVPGLLEELVVEAIRGLPKAKRRLLAPATQTGRQVLDRISAADTSDATKGVTTAVEAPETERAASPSQDAKATKSSAQDDEPDPYSLDASLARLKAWGSGGTVVQSEPKRDRRKQGPKATKAKRSERGPRRGVASDERGPRSERAAAVRGRPRTKPSFWGALQKNILELKGVDLTQADITAARKALPPHLRIGFQVVDGRGAILGYDHSLARLQKRFADHAATSLQSTVREALESAQRSAQARQDDAGSGGSHHTAESESGFDASDGGEQTSLFADLLEDRLDGLPETAIPKVIETQNSRGQTVRGYPALVLANQNEAKSGAQAATSGARGLSSDGPTGSGPAVSLVVRGTADEARKHWADGLTQLLLNRMRLATGRVTSRWSGSEALLLSASPYRSTETLVEDAQFTAMRRLVDAATGGKPQDVRSAKQFADLEAAVRDQFEDEVYRLLGQVVAAVKAYSAFETAMDNHPQTAYKSVQSQSRTHARTLFFDGYLRDLPAPVLPHVPRYLSALAHRVERAAQGRTELLQDRKLAIQIREVQEEFDRIHSRILARPFSATVSLEMEQIKMLMEELRVSLFAQSLGVSQRVSPARLLRRLENVERTV